MKIGVSYTPTVSTESQPYIISLLINSIGKGMLDAAEAIAQMITSHLKSGALTPKSTSGLTHNSGLQHMKENLSYMKPDRFYYIDKMSDVQFTSFVDIINSQK